MGKPKKEMLRKFPFWGHFRHFKGIYALDFSQKNLGGGASFWIFPDYQQDDLDLGASLFGRGFTHSAQPPSCRRTV